MSENRIEKVFPAVCAAVFVAHALSFRYTVDDAFISFRYARNWVEGAGLVYNPTERVEGYTNFLWTVFAAVPIRLGLDVEWFMKIAGIAAGVVLIFAVWSYGRSRLGERPLALLLPLPLAASGALALWSGAGLETSLFSLLVFAGVAAAAGERGKRPFLRSALLLALATLTRPEGALVFAVVVGERLAAHRSAALRDLLPALALFLAVLVPYEAWRIAYYGDALPNTYYAKSGGGVYAAIRGVKYLLAWAGPFGGWTILAPLPLVFLVRVKPWERTFLAVAAVLTAYVVLVGGDGLPYYRFLVPLLPLFTLLSLSGLAKLFPWPTGAIGTVRLAAFALLFALPAYSSFGGASYRFLVQDRQRIELHWKVIGRWIGEHAKEGETMAVATAGVIPYYGRIPTVDMLGITDRTIGHRKMPDMGKGIAGHEKNDMEYVLSRKPTYIFHYTFLLPEPVFTTGQFKTPWNPGLRELLESERFNREYKGESAPIGKMYLVYFRRREGV